MKDYQVDTNALLRYLTHDVPNQYQKVRRLFNKAKTGEVALNICEPVFIETAVMLKNYFKFPKGQIVDFLHDLLNASYLNIENSSQLAPAVDAYSQNSIDFVDAILLIRAYIDGRRIFTFDRKLSLLASPQKKAD